MPWCSVYSRFHTESRSLHRDLTHSCTLQPVFTWLLCDAHEWRRRRTARILLCCGSLLCVSEALCGCLFGCTWTADVYRSQNHTDISTYIVNHTQEPTQWITAPVCLAGIIILNRNKKGISGYCHLCWMFLFTHSQSKQPLNSEKEKDRHAKSKL